jgi:DNA invertase Pin-like site-specific DNA recombinase
MTTAIYLRQSLDRDHDKVSIDYQREQLHKLCSKRGWTDPVQYLDRSVSASKGTRPAYAELCRDIAAGTIARVLVWDMDRLHRQPRELEDFIDLADTHHVELANVAGDVDLSTPSGRLFARVTGSVAKYEVEQKSKRQKSANAERAKRGTAWVSRPFGYTMKVDREAAAERARSRAKGEARDAGKGDKQAQAAGDAAYQARYAAWSRSTDATDNKLVKREADAIRRACRDLLNGATLMSIAKQWNKAELKSSRGCEWTGGQVRQVLLRPRNAGLQVYDVHGAHRNGHSAILEGVETPWPAIVSRDEYEAVCALLADPKRHTGKSPGRVYLLSGIALCGKCGKAVGSGARRLKRGGYRPVYQCKHCLKIVRDLEKTDERVIQSVTKRLAQPDAAATLAKPAVDTAGLRGQIDLLRAQIAQAEHDYDDGLITAQRMNARIERTNAKLAPLHDKLIGVHMSRDVRELAGKPDARERFDALPLDRRRGVIDTLATVTIRAQNTAGGRFDPAAVTVEHK